MPERRKRKNLRSSKHAARRPKAKAAAPKPRKAAGPKAPKAGAPGAVSVYDLQGKAKGTLTVDPLFQGLEVNTDVIYQAVLRYRAGEREGTASTKDRAQVRGGGKKPWKQKGTGQARHGSRRSPIWKGGGVTFGPKPRDYTYALPAEIKRRAVIEGMRDKVRAQKLLVVEGLGLEAPKTSLLVKILKAFKLEKPLFLVAQKDENLLRASRNIAGISVKTDRDVNALDVVSHRECLMTQDAYKGLLKRLKS